jgi:hypothetical protein
VKEKPTTSLKYKLQLNGKIIKFFEKISDDND